MKNYRLQKGCWSCWHSVVSFQPHEISCGENIENFNELSKEEQEERLVENCGICDKYSNCDLLFKEDK